MAIKPIRLIKNFMTVGLWTLGSRLLGFVRDILIAATLGTGPVSEAFFVAFSLPNMFRRFFAEGAFNTAFVPLFSKKLEGGDNPQAFAQDAFSALASILIALSLIAQLAMPWFVAAMASGFIGDERFDLAVDFGRIAFAYIIFISLAALFSGILNATGRFAAASAAPILLNIVLVAALLYADFVKPSAGGPELNTMSDEYLYGLFLTWGVPLAGVAQLGLVWFAAARAGFNLRPRLPRISPDIKHLAAIMGPAMLAGGVVQINLLVGRQVASFFDGAIVWLGFADRLYQLPLGLVGIAIGVVLLPDLSRRLRAGDDTGARHAFSRAGQVAMALTIPCAVALMVVPAPLVGVLFERGAFTATDTAATAAAVAIYGAGLPAFVLQKVLQPLYFAREDTKSPFRFALVSMVVNAIAAIGLSFVIGYLGAAIGTTLAAWVMVGLLMRGRRDMGDAARFDTGFRRSLLPILAASALMGAACWAGVFLAGPAFATDGIRYAALAGLVLGGMVIYGAAAWVLGALRQS
jgi:putative peptidoglycan lipid II flippase